MGQERHTRSLHEYWMIASRTRAFGIRHPCAERIQSRRQPSVRRRPQTRSPSLARARLLESFIRHHELHFVIGIVPLHVSRRLITAMPCGPSALNAREPPGCPQRLARCVAMWCDAQRRVVERCDAPRRAALPTVMSISPTRLTIRPSVPMKCRRIRCYGRSGPVAWWLLVLPSALLRHTEYPIALPLGFRT
jgi:hypothetical protein